MTQKWNLQDIRPAQTRKRRVEQNGSSPVSVQQRPVAVNKEDAQEELSIRIIDGNKKKSKSLLYAVVIFFVIVGGGLFASALMGGADVTVYPKHREPNVNALFEAQKEPKAEELAFVIMSLDAEGEKQVKAAGEEQVTAQAVGLIFIYNSAQKEPLRLVTNTRFESSDGKIFKIKDSVVVPGYTTNGSTKLPGVTTAQVYADQPGEAYNIAPGKFTVPGFKGKPEYAAISGESTEAFTGGFNGKRFKIDDAELQTAKQILQTELRNSLLSRIDGEKPAGFVVLPGAVTFTYESLPSVAYGENLATIKEKVHLKIPIFKDENFAQFIAKQTVPGYENDPVRIVDSKVFTFGYANATTSSSDLSVETKIAFNLSGKPQIVWVYDAEKLKTNLLNANKTALTGILGGYPAIEKATAVIRPFWKTKFPIQMDEIKITEVVGSTQ